MKRITLIFTGVILLASCESQDLDDLQDLLTESITDQSHVISADEAIQLARTELKSIPSSFTERSRSQRNYENASVSVVSSNEAPLYIVNFENGGYALVSGNSNDKEPVLVMSSNEHFEVDFINPNSPTNYLIHLASNYTPNPDTLVTIKPNDNPNAPICIEHDGHMCNVYVKRDTIGSKEKHLVRTLWNQDYPYNFFCPTVKGNHCVAGCLPVAMAQIMSYHYQPTSHNGHTYNWGAIHSTITKSSPGDAGAIDCAHLIHDLGVEMGADYGLEATGTPWKNAVQGFKNFGYHTPYESAFTFEIAREELEAEYPILAMGTNSSTGKCHAWVIDGLYCEEVTCTYRRVDNNAPCTSYIYTESEFLHCNWGWGGFQNTFVRPNLFIGYDTNIRIYTNIY